jgi:hypothetical protein
MREGGSVIDGISERLAGKKQKKKHVEIREM